MGPHHWGRMATAIFIGTLDWLPVELGNLYATFHC